MLTDANAWGMVRLIVTLLWFLGLFVVATAITLFLMKFRPTAKIIKRHLPELYANKS